MKRPFAAEPRVVARRASRQPTVSVVIPCFNQGRFLGEAIDSVLRQEGPSVEVVVVDDGSSDQTAEVAGSRKKVVLVRQANQGLAAARNRGLAVTRGRYIVFLDADDRLVPGALAVSVAALDDQPEYAFIYGRFVNISVRGQLLGTARQDRLTTDHYRHLLEKNFIPSPGMVMFRRELFDRIGGFRSTRRLQGSEDYELYLRVTRRFAVACHDRLVLERRRHSDAMSRKVGMMFRHTMAVHRRQWRFVKRDPELRRAYLAGRSWYRRWFGEQLVTETQLLRAREGWVAVVSRLVTLARYHPRGLWAFLRGLPESNHVVFPVVRAELPTRPTVPGRPVHGSLTIVGLQPDQCVVGRGFNQRSDGLSVLEIKCRNATPLTTVILAGGPIPTRFRAADKVSIVFPEELIEAEGTWPLYLLK